MRYLTSLSASLAALAAAALSGAATAQHARPSTDQDIVVTARPLSPRPTPTRVTTKAVNLVGFGATKAGASGTMTFDQDAIAFADSQGGATIPISAVRAFAVERSSKPLLRGMAGTVAMLAPNGAGQLYSAIRLGADMLTIYYVDENEGLHGAVLLIPGKSRAALLDAFASAGVPTNEDPAIVTSGGDAGVFHAAGTTRPVRSADAPAVMVDVPDTRAVPVPAGYRAAVYENLVEQTAKGRLFATVWRQGDRRADGREIAMTLRITGFRKGSAGIRGAIPVVGMIAGKTLITAQLELRDPAGATIVDREVKGSKRMLGESMAASKSLAQRVVRSLSKVPDLTGPLHEADTDDDRAHHTVAAR